MYVLGNINLGGSQELSRTVPLEESRATDIGRGELAMTGTIKKIIRQKGLDSSLPTTAVKMYSFIAQSRAPNSD